MIPVDLTLLPDDLLSSSILSPPEKKALAYFLQKCGKDDTVCLSAMQIGNDLGLESSTAKTKMKQLHEARYIDRAGCRCGAVGRQHYKIRIMFNRQTGEVGPPLPKPSWSTPPEPKVSYAVRFTHGRGTVAVVKRTTRGLQFPTMAAELAYFLDAELGPQRWQDVSGIAGHYCLFLARRYGSGSGIEMSLHADLSDPAVGDVPLFVMMTGRRDKSGRPIVELDGKDLDMDREAEPVQEEIDRLRALDW